MMTGGEDQELAPGIQQQLNLIINLNKDIFKNSFKIVHLAHHNVLEEWKTFAPFDKFVESLICHPVQVKQN